jgi:hypothetical protein
MLMIGATSMTRRFGAVLIVLSSIMFVACRTSPTEPNPDAAIRAALVASGFADSLQIFPQQPGQMPCIIHGGGPPPGISLSGTCETSAVWNGSLFIVTLTEVWEASAFHDGDFDPGSGQLSHSWQYKIDGSGNAKSVGDWGNFPPQAAY